MGHLYKRQRVVLPGVNFINLKVLSLTSKVISPNFSAPCGLSYILPQRDHSVFLKTIVKVSFIFTNKSKIGYLIFPLK